MSRQVLLFLIICSSVSLFPASGTSHERDSENLIGKTKGEISQVIFDDALVDAVYEFSELVSNYTFSPEDLESYIRMREICFGSRHLHFTANAFRIRHSETKWLAIRPSILALYEVALAKLDWINGNFKDIPENFSNLIEANPLEVKYRLTFNSIQDKKTKLEADTTTSFPTPLSSASHLSMRP